MTVSCAIKTTIERPSSGHTRTLVDSAPVASPAAAPEPGTAGGRGAPDIKPGTSEALAQVFMPWDHTRVSAVTMPPAINSRSRSSV